jgi:hypothetical protein
MDLMFRDIGLNRQRFMRACAIGFAGACLPSWVARAQSVSAGRPDPKLIEDLVSANCILALQGVVDAYGHVSARHDQNPSRYLLSRTGS